MSLSRKQFYEQYRDVFCWFDTEDYACYDVLTVSRQTIEEIKTAAAQVWQVLQLAGKVMKSFDDRTLETFGYPPASFRLLRTTAQPPFIARCDFAVTPKGIYLLECNADVATFIVETFKINGLVAAYFGKKDPNQGSENILRNQLKKYIENTAKLLKKSPLDCRIVFAAMGTADEDVGTVEYLRNLCDYPAYFSPIESLTMDENFMYDSDDEPIDILYRLYPIEWMVEDRDPHSEAYLWDYLEPLVFAQKVALINPVSAFLLQNKALMALITQLGQPNLPEELFPAFKYFLPTFLQQSKIKLPYVSKPIWGREGKELMIFQQEESVISNPDSDYANWLKIYQEYVELPQLNWNQTNYTLQFSCFIVNGIATGVGARIGEKIITNNSKFIPIGYANH